MASKSPAKPSLLPSPTEPPRLLSSREAMDSASTPNAQAYELLKDTKDFQSLGTELQVPKLSRRRVKLAQKDLRAPCLELLNSDELMWLRRLNVFTVHHEDGGSDEESDEEYGAEKHPPILTDDYIILNVLCKDNIERFKQHLDGLPKSLSPVTLRKGFYSLASCIQKILGKNLSRAKTPAVKQAAQGSLDKLADCAGDFAKSASITLARSEITRILNYETLGIPATAVISKLYYLMVCERERFLSSYGGSHPSREDLRRATGYVIFTLAVCRPPTRPNVYRDLRCDALAGRLFEGSPVSVLTANHKTSASFGALCILWPSYAVDILVIYLRAVRPMLIRSDQWNKGSKQVLFPQDHMKCVEVFNTYCGISINLSSIRSLFSIAVGEIDTCDLQWARYKNDLEACCAHKVGVAGKTIEQHYQINSKIKREELLQKYLREVYYTPAIQKMRTELKNFNSSDEEDQHLVSVRSPCHDVELAKCSTITATPSYKGPDSSKSDPPRQATMERGRLRDVEPSRRKLSAPPQISDAPSLDTPQRLILSSDDSLLGLERAPESHCSKKRPRPEAISISSDEDIGNVDDDYIELADCVAPFEAPATLSLEFKSILNTRLQEGFRSDFHLGGEALLQILRTGIQKMYPGKFREEKQLRSQSYQHILNLTTAHAKSLLKNYLNKLPIKIFTAKIMESSSVLTVGLIKTVISRDAVEAALSRHVCFRGHPVSDMTIKRLRKETEQMILSKKGQLDNNEIPGPTGDLSGHFRGWCVWRRGGLFSIIPYQDMEVLEADHSTESQTDYVPSLSARRSSKKKQIKLTDNSE